MKFLLLIILILTSRFVSCQPRYAVIINEMMADPLPVAGLPAYEWIELFNRSDEVINLQSWRLGDESSLSGPFPGYSLGPKQYLILCGASARSAMEAYGPVLVVPSFPSLDNAGETIYLLSADGKVIHAVRYSVSWYDNSLKEEGGWSLEMTDADNPCQGASNWKPSVHPSGGTPGSANSVATVNADHIPPLPLRTYTRSPSSIAIVFNEPLDSSNAVQPGHYGIDLGLTIKSAACGPPLFEEVILETAQPMATRMIYNINVNGVTDCAQNAMTNTIHLKAAQTAAPLEGRCVINEILFNPESDGHDYVEIYNAGVTVVDASQLYLSGRNSGGQLSAPARLSLFPFTVFPGDYIVATADPRTLDPGYQVKAPDRILRVSPMPSLPDDRGTVVLQDFQGNILDEVGYDQDWHHKLISDPEGVSLERIDPLGPSSKGENWHSAASTAGYGTPGYINSQFRAAPSAVAGISVIPKVFSPDNDGWDDIVRIAFKASASGFIANVFIFDASGRQVKHLVRNELISAEGYWNWNGLNGQQQPLPVGIYIIHAEFFDLQGVKQHFRRAVVLAKKLN